MSGSRLLSLAFIHRYDAQLHWFSLASHTRIQYTTHWPTSIRVYTVQACTWSIWHIVPCILLLYSVLHRYKNERKKYQRLTLTELPSPYSIHAMLSMKSRQYSKSQTVMFVPFASTQNKKKEKEKKKPNSQWWAAAVATIIMRHLNVLHATCYMVSHCNWKHASNNIYSLNVCVCVWMRIRIMRFFLFFFIRQKQSNHD